MNRRKPIEVVPEHRNRAVALWLVLIVAVTVCEWDAEAVGLW